MEFDLSKEITKCGLCKENLQPFLRVEDVKEFIRIDRKIISDSHWNLLSSILLWFLCENIKIDEKRLKRLFEGSIKNTQLRRNDLLGEDLNVK